MSTESDGGLIDNNLIIGNQDSSYIAASFSGKRKAT